MSWKTEIKKDNSNIDNGSCYIIEIQNETVNNNKKMYRALFFRCKQEISLKYVLSKAYINSMENLASTPLSSETLWTTETSSMYKSPSSKVNTINHFLATTNAQSLKSKGNESTIAGASVAGILAMTLIALVDVFFFKRRRLKGFNVCKQNKSHTRTVLPTIPLTINLLLKVIGTTTTIHIPLKAFSYNKQGK